MYRDHKGIKIKYFERDGASKAIAPVTAVVSDKRYTADQAAAYYSQKSGKQLSGSSLRTNAKKYGFQILEKGSGLYALIDAQNP